MKKDFKMMTISEALHTLKSLNKKLSDKKLVENLEQVYSEWPDNILQVRDIEDNSWDDPDATPGQFKKFLGAYAKDPVIAKYSTKSVYDTIKSSDKILEMTSEDFGDGHGDPKGYIFARDGKVAYMILSSNDALFYPSISFSEFKHIVQGWDLAWFEVGFGQYKDTGYGHTLEDAIESCEIEDEIYYCNKDQFIY